MLQEILNRCIDIDFEYRGTNNATYDMVAMAVDAGGESEAVWLHNDAQKKKDAKDWIIHHRDSGAIFVSFNVDAEARSFMSLGIDPTKCKWIDIQAEWKMLINHNVKWAYGAQAIDGKLVYTQPYFKNPGANNSKPDKSLVAATFKLLGELEDLKHKNEMRDLIIHTKQFAGIHKYNILNYAKGDVKNLSLMLKKIHEAHSKLMPRSYFDTEQYWNDMLWRGECVARTAVMASIGYPVEEESLLRFIRNCPTIVQDIQREINEMFPELKLFEWNKKTENFVTKMNNVRKMIADSPYADRWAKTDTGKLSTSVEEFSKYYHFRHSYPNEPMPQFLRYLRTKQQLNGFPIRKNSNKESFLAYYGSDKRAHPYLNAYGAQSSRFQPKATGYIPLKAAWMRSLITPKKGRAICGIDYASQEFLIAALVSNDQNMINAYKSGDVYLYFAKLAEAVPWDGTKKEYAEERGRFKSTTLGISYQMGPVALAAKLTQDTGIPHTTEQAKELIRKFEDAYPDYTKFRAKNWREYTDRSRACRHIMLPDGWFMWGDNPNERSVNNMPIQGYGACILRKAIQLCQEEGIKVILPLHDACYAEMQYTNLPEQIDQFNKLMIEAFIHFFPDNPYAKLVRTDINVWGPEVSKYANKVPYKCQEIYVDERSIDEFEKFRKYME